ncbi:MAG: hypothetical protein EA380_11630 [Phycisphaeraceae bacterium]|nr:MAG: hypothetical protein EA380_11630 [Phycisphaeraceae bacterium]
MVLDLRGALSAAVVLVGAGMPASGAFMGPMGADAGFEGMMQRAGGTLYEFDVSDPRVGVLPGMLSAFSSGTVSGGQNNDHTVVSRVDVMGEAESVWGEMAFVSQMSIAPTTVAATAWYAEVSAMLEMAAPGAVDLSGVLMHDGAAEIAGRLVLTPVERGGEAIEYEITPGEHGVFAARIGVGAGVYEARLSMVQAHEAVMGGSWAWETTMSFALHVPAPGVSFVLLGMAGVAGARRRCR